MSPNTKIMATVASGVVVARRVALAVAAVVVIKRMERSNHMVIHLDPNVVDVVDVADMAQRSMAIVAAKITVAAETPVVALLVAILHLALDLLHVNMLSPIKYPLPHSPIARQHVPRKPKLQDKPNRTAAATVSASPLLHPLTRPRNRLP